MDDGTLVYVGTYTEDDRQEGVFLLRLSETGELSLLRGFDVGPNPSFLAIHPDGRHLYAVNEISEWEGEPAGAVTAVAISSRGERLEVLNRQSSRGKGPCHVSLDSSGKFALVANYGGGSAAVLPIHSDGTLGPSTDFVQHTGAGPNPRRQASPHAHSVNLDARDRYAFVADLGLDKIFVYAFDAAKGLLEPAEEPWLELTPGAGPRHFVLHPNQEWAYVLNELSSTIGVLRFDSGRGRFEILQEISTLPQGFDDENWTAEVVLGPEGRYLYASNRGHDSVAVFRIDGSSGRLEFQETVPTRGKTPRNFAIDPSGRFLIAANQNSANLAVFRIDPAAGGLTPVGEPVEVPRPVCVRFLKVE